MKRPTSWLVFGILLLVFGGLSLIGNAITLATTHGNLRLNADPSLDLIKVSPNYALFLRISAQLGILICAAQLLGGIGLVRFRPWGRTVSLGYAWYALASGVIGLALVLPALMEIVARHGGTDPKHITAIGVMIGGLIGGLIALSLPILMLVFLWRDPHKSAATTVSVAREASDNPYQPPSAG